MLPYVSSAHGGVEKSTGNVVVYLTQSPISPLVGEKVEFTFVIIRTDTQERLVDFPVTLAMIDTFYGDATLDKTLLIQQNKTDVNGAFKFEYTFNKENFFDLDLELTDPVTNEPLDMGFLVQPRTAEDLPGNLGWPSLVTVGLIGVMIGLTIKRCL